MKKIQLKNCRKTSKNCPAGVVLAGETFLKQFCSISHIKDKHLYVTGIGSFLVRIKEVKKFKSPASFSIQLRGTGKFYRLRGSNSISSTESHPLARSLTYSISCSKGIKLTRAAQLVHFQFILTAAASASTRSESGKRQQQQQQQQNNEKRLFAVKYSQLRSPAQTTDSKINPGKYYWSSSVYVRICM